MYDNLELREQFNKKLKSLNDIRIETLEREIILFAESKLESNWRDEVNKGQIFIFDHIDKIEFKFDNKLIFSMELEFKNFNYSYLITRYYK